MTRNKSIPRKLREKFHADRVLSHETVDIPERQFGEWIDFSDIDEFEYRHEFWEMRFQDSGIAELYVEEVDFEEFDKPLYVVYLEEVITEQRKAVAIDFNPAEAQNLLHDYKKENSADQIKEKIEQLKGENQ